ncbi:MAG: hypothetical protein KDA89_10915 [Planctomycetaceae bacterium]|nr:hypothetical protein [Planctomycetaceae bacterium]
MADGIGIEFTETMRGYLSLNEHENYERGHDRGCDDGSPFEFTVTVSADNLDRFFDDPAHQAALSGTVTAPALSDEPLQVNGGSFHLFQQDPERVMTRRMNYHMPLKAADGRSFFLEGHKIIHDDHGFDMWRDTTTLFVTLHEGDDVDGPVAGKGIVRILPADFRRQLCSMKAVNAGSKLEELKALSRFGRFFAGVLFDLYGGIFARPNVFNPDAPPRERRPLRCGDPEIHLFTTEDGVQLKLSRYQGGSRGPVILTPGFGTSALAFTIDTTDTNFPEYLFERGYDVWVFDYRASPDLPSAGTQFTLDDVATKDYPAAVKKVLSETGADDLQVMAHCVGSQTLLMSLLSGLEGVRSAVSSQLTLHPVAPPLNRIKAGLDLANFLTVLGVDTLSTDFDTRSNWTDRMYDKLLRLYPTKERCNSPVCRRILFMYGEVYDHSQLNEATHAAIHEMFGVANLTTFKQISRMLKAGQVVSADGEDCYLPNYERLKLPITFVHGENNRLFLPEGSLKTYEFLCDRNGTEYYDRIVFPGYAHMDCFLGRNADRDVYPQVTAALDAYN